MKILFVCTGNTCRSPLAEVIARRLLAERAMADVSVSSAGTTAHGGAPASDGSLQVAREQGIDLSGHRARLLTAELVQTADLVLTMGSHHLERAAALGGEGKSHMLATYASRGESDRAVSDPFGADVTVYRATFAELAREIGNVLDRISADRLQTRA